MIAFDAGAYILVSYSYNQNLQRETENSVREQDVILASITNRIARVEGFYPDVSTNAERLYPIIQSLAVYHQPQGVRIGLFWDQDEIFSNLPELDRRLLDFDNSGNKPTMHARVDGTRYVFVASTIPEYPHLSFVYARDISQLDDFRTDISRVFILINAIVLVVLGSLIFLLLKHMVSPITSMNAAAIEISNGVYEKRVSIARSDELGTLAQSFNRMAESIEEHMVQLNKTAEDKQQFIDDLTHEMRTPLTSILGYAEYLQNAFYTEEDRLIATSHLYESAFRLQALSSKLLKLTLLRGEGIEFSNVYIPDLFKALTVLIQASLNSQRLTLTTSAEPVYIKGDEALLLSLLTNLVENAARASKPAATISVTAYQKGGNKSDFIVIEVGDTGIGMDEKEIERITTPFYRIDKSRSRIVGGAGLGLSIVSQIVALHNAELSIESKKGLGTIVRVYFTTPKQTRNIGKTQRGYSIPQV